MARSFNGSSQYITWGTSIGTPTGRTMMAVFNADTLSGYGTVICQYDNGGSNLFWFGHNGSQPTLAIDNGTYVETGSGTFSTGTWYIAVIRQTSATAKEVDWGTIGGTPTNFTQTGNSGGTNNEDSLRVGAGYFSGAVDYFDGNIAEACAWSVALTDAQVLELFEGVSPVDVATESLGFYHPLVRSNHRDELGNILGTETASPGVAVHPRICAHAGSSQGIFIDSGGGGGGPTLITSTDTLSTSLTESTLNSLTSTRPETLSVSLVESTTNDLTSSRTDSITVSIADVVQELAVLLGSTDTVSVGLTDSVSDILSVIDSADTLALAITENVGDIFAELSPTDTLAVGVTDTVNDLYVTLNRSDTASVSLGDLVSSLLVEIATNDTINISLGDLSDLIIAVITSDTLTVAIGSGGAVVVPVTPPAPGNFMYIPHGFGFGRF